MKKGYTLVELLAVIVIISLIGIITVPIATSYIEKSRVESYRISAENVIEVAKEYVAKEEENHDFPETGISVKKIEEKIDGKIISGRVKRNGGFAMGRYRKRKKKENRMGKLCVSGIVFMFLIVMSIQIVKLYKEDQTYIAKEKELNEQLEDATEEQQQLADYEQYTQSQQYIEEVAKSKLGLVYNNEIVFKEQDTEDGK